MDDSDDLESAARPPLRTGDVRDFDFLAGVWTVKNRTLRLAANGSESWDEYPATSRMRIYLGGVVNVDEFDFPTKGYSAVALRIFNVETRQWAIYWIESRTGVLLPPVFGGFNGEAGEFYGDDEVGGEPAVFRFVWARLGTDQARWEQSSSRDLQTWKSTG